MCLITDFRDPFVTKKDLFVFKRLNRYLSIRNKNKYYYQTPHRSFIMEPNSHYKNYGPNKFTFYERIATGIEINQGLHAYFNLETALKSIDGRYLPKESIVIMTVPKNSQYYLNIHNTEIVSDNLIWYEESKILQGTKLLKDLIDNRSDNYFLNQKLESWGIKK